MQVTWVVLQFDTAKISKSKITPEELRQKVGDLVFGHKAGYTIHRIVLVGNDIDVYDDKDVMWAFTTRCRPNKDEVRSHFHSLLTPVSTQSDTLLYPFQTFFEECKGFPLIPYMSHGTGHPAKGGKVVSDAIMPAEYATGLPDWQAADFKKCVPSLCAFLLLPLYCFEAVLTSTRFCRSCSSYPEDVKQKVLANWTSDGFAPL